MLFTVLFTVQAALSAVISIAERKSRPEMAVPGCTRSQQRAAKTVVRRARLSCADRRGRRRLLVRYVLHALRVCDRYVSGAVSRRVSRVVPTTTHYGYTRRALERATPPWIAQMRSF